MDRDETLTLAGVAVDLHCSKAHVSNLIRGRVAGVTPLPAIRLGRRVLVRRRTLDDWKRANERAAGGDTLSTSPKTDTGRRREET